MKIESIRPGIAEPKATVLESAKNTFSWAGRQVSKGWNKFTEAVKSAWNTAFPFLKNSALCTFNFLRTGPGLGLILGSASLALLYAANTNREKKWASLALQTSAIVLAIGAGTVSGYSYAVGFRTPLI